MKYVLYTRKSTDSEDRQIQSNEDQQKECQKTIKHKGIKIAKNISESQTAKKPGRPKFDEIFQMIKSGKADGIVCWKLNRLARNPIDGGEIQWLLQQGKIKSILTPSREYLPTDNMIPIAVELGMANQFILDLSKDVKRGMKSKIEKGWWPHKAPQGYMNDKFGDKGEKKIFRDPERFELVHKMWKMLLTGQYSVPQIAEIASKEWGFVTIRGKKLGSSTLYRIFRNMFYCGQFEYDGEIFKGSHEAMISTREYDRAQMILGKQGRPRPKTKRLPFMGVIECGYCGGMVTADEKVKHLKSTGETKSYIYHRCTHRKKYKKCDQKAIKYEQLEKQVKEIIDSITIPEEFLNWALEICRRDCHIEEQNQNHVLKNLHNQHEKIVKSMGNLIKLYTSSENTDMSLLSTEEYKEQKKALQIEKQRIEDEMRRNESDINNWLELTEKTFHFATYAKKWFDEGDYDKKTEILGCLGQNFIFVDGKLSLQLAKQYSILKEGLKKETALKARFELNSVSVQSQKESLLNLWSG